MYNHSNIESLTNDIKTKAKALGFMSCGISKAGFLEEEAPKLEYWLNKNMNGEMSYMERNFDMRLDPTKIVEGAKSVISLTYNYYTEKTCKDSNFKISKYAYGNDYHFVIKNKLKDLFEYIKEKTGDINGRVFISKKNGSFFFLCEIILDLELEYDHIETDHCGSCTACIDACPTNAIVEPYVVDGTRCISYYTIELKNNIPDYAKNTYDDWIFGCDICQDVCPWNRFSKPHKEPLFNSDDEFLSMNKNDWIEMTKETFNKVFKNSAIKRAGFDGIKRNIEFIKRK